MRPTDKFGTFNSTSGGVETDTDAAEETVVATFDDDVGEAVVDGITGDEVREEGFEEVVAQRPSGMKVNNPRQATRARRIK
jgi:hypothetical protein